MTNAYLKDEIAFPVLTKPRLGSGYPLAYECGCNFPGYILNNLEGDSNPPVIGEYPQDIYMFKKDAYIIHKL